MTKGVLNELFKIQYVDGCYNDIGAGKNSGKYTSLNIGPNDDTIYMSYYDISENGNLKFATKEFNSPIWQTMIIDESGDTGYYTSLKIDNSGDAHISYRESTNGNLKYAYGPSGSSNSTWQIFEVDASGNTGNYSWIDIDNFKNRHIAYYDNNGTELLYAFGPSGNNSINWNIYKIDGSGNSNIGLYPSLFVDASQSIHISYIDRSLSKNNLKYAKGNFVNNSTDMSWQIFDVSDGTDIFDTTAMVQDNSGNKHIGYFDDETPRQLRYAFAPKDVDISWTLYTINDPSFNFGEVSIDLEPISKKPVLLYFIDNGDGTKTPRLATQTENSNTWKTETINIKLDGTGSNGREQIKFDDTGYKHISFHNNDSNTLGYLAYATNSNTNYGDLCDIASIENVTSTSRQLKPSKSEKRVPVSQTNPSNATSVDPSDIQIVPVNPCN